MAGAIMAPDLGFFRFWADGPQGSRFPTTPHRSIVWQTARKSSATSTAFEVTSKRRKGYPSESRVKRGDRIVHGDKELLPREARP